MRVRVKDLMSGPAVVVGPEASLRDVASVLSRHHISGVPVVRHGEVLGVISESNIVEKERGPDEKPTGVIARHHHRPRSPSAYATTAGEAMSSPAIAVDAWMSAYEAAWLMSVHDVGRLPVLDRGELVGVITRADLVRYFARPDDEIARDVHEEVIEVLPAPDVAVDVDRGRVVLTGEVDTEADLMCLPHAVSRVPGVVAVRSQVMLRTPSTVALSATSP